MGCFCHATMAPLRLMLPQLHMAENVALGIPGADVPMSLSVWLSARGLPVLPWAPNPAWLNLKLPQMQMSMQAVATISAMATMRAQVLAQFGIDLLNPRQAAAFARIVATMSARLSLLANIQFNPLAWLQLSALLNAVVQVELALKAGLLLPPANLHLALTMPGGVPLPNWKAFLAALMALLPMISATAQLSASLTETAQLSAALRVMARLQLPVLPPGQLQLMASLTAALTAVAQIQMHLGLPMSPLELGPKAIAIRIQARLAALLAALRVQMNIAIPPGGSLLAALLALLPPLPPVPLPTLFATKEVVMLAMRMQAIAAVNWQVPAVIPALQIGLPTCALVAQLNESLNLKAVLPAPCGSGCDAAKIMSALA